MKEKTGKKKAPYKRGCTSYCYMLFRKYILVWQVHLFNENFTKGAFMAVLKNKTQRNFTMISNSVLRDKELSMKDRGVLCTICSLPDGWEFSIAGLSSIVPDGVEAIRKSIFNLERLGYMERTKTRGKGGKYISEIEVFMEKRAVSDYPSRENHHGETVAGEPIRENRHGTTVTGNPTQYNTDNYYQAHYNKLIFHL